MRGSRQSISLQNVRWTTLLDLLPYLAAYKFRISVAMLCLIGAKAAGIRIHFLLAKAVDRLGLNVDDVALQSVAAVSGLVVAYGVIRFLSVFLGEIRDSLFGYVTEGAMHQTGHKVFKHLHALDLDFHLNRRTGGLSRDIERGVNGISFLLRFMVFNILPTLIEIALIIGLLLWNFSAWFAVILSLSVTCYISFSVVATEWRTRFIAQVNEAESASSNRSVDSLLNYETVKYFNNEAYEASLYDKNLRAWASARRRNRLTLFALNSGQSLITSASIAGALLLAANGVTKGELSVGDFVLINSLMLQIFVPLNFLGFVYREIKSSLASIDAMFGLLKIQPKVTDAHNAPKLALRHGDVHFNSVCFSYDPQRPILRNVSFHLPAKQQLAIVGRSGSGKSTLTKLLFRFYDVEGGEILIDDQNIASVSQASLRRHIAVVPQDAVLFNSSIFDNILYGRIDASEKEVWNAIKTAHLDDFVLSLPEKGDTLVGERGLKLSGGEKQRVAIARALLKNPSILVFDEATSSLDSRSERKILQAMESIRGRCTLLVIAHRLSTIVDADRIIVLEKGKIVEAGNHTDLLQQGGYYASMWYLQQTKQSVPISDPD